MGMVMNASLRLGGLAMLHLSIFGHFLKGFCCRQDGFRAVCLCVCRKKGEKQKIKKYDYCEIDLVCLTSPNFSTPSTVDHNGLKTV